MKKKCIFLLVSLFTFSCNNNSNVIYNYSSTDNINNNQGNIVSKLNDYNLFSRTN
ncbi:MAG: hypothetical protein KatS3mg068_0909 [Candidatus Sericytochromatia bacterium]|nr:MAG: hypothetical protein KatS3mg068_0909 [Candidatus Sericytochromatia bacterium]